MAAAGIRTRVTSLDNRDATRYATAPTLQASFVARKDPVFVRDPPYININWFDPWSVSMYEQGCAPKD